MSINLKKTNINNQVCVKISTCCQRVSANITTAAFFLLSQHNEGQTSKTPKLTLKELQSPESVHRLSIYSSHTHTHKEAFFLPKSSVKSTSTVQPEAQQWSYESLFQPQTLCCAPQRVCVVKDGAVRLLLWAASSSAPTGHLVKVEGRMDGANFMALLHSKSMSVCFKTHTHTHTQSFSGIYYTHEAKLALEMPIVLWTEMAVHMFHAT